MNRFKIKGWSGLKGRKSVKKTRPFSTAEEILGLTGRWTTAPASRVNTLLKRKYLDSRFFIVKKIKERNVRKKSPRHREHRNPIMRMKPLEGEVKMPDVTGPQRQIWGQSLQIGLPRGRDGFMFWKGRSRGGSHIHGCDRRGKKA